LLRFACLYLFFCLPKYRAVGCVYAIMIHRYRAVGGVYAILMLGHRATLDVCCVLCVVCCDL
jgi:hypothetical protein